MTIATCGACRNASVEVEQQSVTVLSGDVRIVRRVHCKTCGRRSAWKRAEVYSGICHEAWALMYVAAPQGASK